MIRISLCINKIRDGVSPVTAAILNVCCCDFVVDIVQIKFETNRIVAVNCRTITKKALWTVTVTNPLRRHRLLSNNFRILAGDKFVGSNIYRSCAECPDRDMVGKLFHDSSRSWIHLSLYI